ncbi:hypothetical protein ABE10_02980, partial [Bacillus toyonensis]|nr:hypothetical protein [Bacillus toyonensis]
AGEVEVQRVRGLRRRGLEVGHDVARVRLACRIERVHPGPDVVVVDLERDADLLQARLQDLAAGVPLRILPGDAPPGEGAALGHTGLGEQLLRLVQVVGVVGEVAAEPWVRLTQRVVGRRDEALAGVGRVQDRLPVGRIGERLAGAHVVERRRRRVHLPRRPL